MHEEVAAFAAGWLANDGDSEKGKDLCASRHSWIKKVLGLDDVQIGRVVLMALRVGGWVRVDGGIAQCRWEIERRYIYTYIICNGWEESFVRQVYFLDSVPGQGLFDIFIVYSKNDLRFTECSSECILLLRCCTTWPGVSCLRVYTHI